MKRFTIEAAQEKHRDHKRTLAIPKNWQDELGEMKRHST